jgi:hypothetical protein
MLCLIWWLMFLLEKQHASLYPLACVHFQLCYAMLNRLMLINVRASLQVSIRTWYVNYYSRSPTMTLFTSLDGLDSINTTGSNVERLRMPFS